MSQVLPYDPDFDEPKPQTTHSKNIFDVLGAKHAFAAGVISTWVIVCAVGFVVLLTAFLRAGASRV